MELQGKKKYEAMNMTDEYIDIDKIKSHQRKETVKKAMSGFLNASKKLGTAVGQGATAVGQGAKKAADKIDAYQKAAPERRAKKIKRLEEEEKRLLQLRKERNLQNRINKLRQSSRPQSMAPPSMLEGGIFGMPQNSRKNRRNRQKEFSIL